MRVRTLLALGVLATLAVGGPALAQGGFRSPDDSIHCLWRQDGGPTCEVNWATNRRSYKPRDCERMIDGLQYSLDGTGRTTLICNMGDSVRDESFPVLAHGATRRGNGVTCAMRPDGVRCENGARHGFTLGRGRETLF